MHFLRDHSLFCTKKISIQDLELTVTRFVISQNGTSPSEYRHSSCWYTKGHFGLKWPKHYKWAWPLMHFPQTNLVYFYYELWVAYTTICIETHVSYMIICISTRVYLHTRVPFEQLACTLSTRVSLKKGVYHTQISYIITHVYLNLKLKYIKHD